MKHLSRLAAPLVALALLAAVLLAPDAALAYGTRTADAGSDAEFAAAMADADVGTVTLTASVSYGGAIDKTVNLGGYTLSLASGASVSGVVAGGTIQCDALYSSGTIDSCSVSGDVFNSGSLLNASVGGTRYEPYAIAVAGVTDVSYDGTTYVPVEPVGGGYYWVVYGRGVVSVKANGAVYAWGSDTHTLCRQYRYSCMVYGTGTLLASGVYTTGDKPIALPAKPTFGTMTFIGWTSENDPNLTTLKTSYSIPTGTVPSSGDTLLYVASFVNGGGTSTGDKTGGGTSGRSAGSGSATTDAALATETADTALPAETAGTEAAATTVSGRGARVVAASSSTKTHIDGSVAAVVMPTRTEYGTDSEKPFPWALVGAIALLASGVGGMLFLLKRKSDARMAAVLEKLHIHE